MLLLWVVLCIILAWHYLSSFINCFIFPRWRTWVRDISRWWVRLMVIVWSWCREKLGNYNWNKQIPKIWRDGMDFSNRVLSVGVAVSCWCGKNPNACWSPPKSLLGARPKYLHIYNGELGLTHGNSQSYRLILPRLQKIGLQICNLTNIIICSAEKKESRRKPVCCRWFLQVKQLRTHS